MKQLVFFKQSAIILLGTVSGGVISIMLTAMTQRYLNKDAYSSYEFIRTAMTQLLIPFSGLQFLLAQLTAKSGMVEGGGSAVSGALRGFARNSLILWLVLATFCLSQQSWILRTYNLPGLGIVALGLGAGWVMLTTPLLMGMLQGRQRFLEYSVAKVGVDVFLFAGIGAGLILGGGSPTAAIAGLLGGSLMGLGVAAFLTRNDWRATPTPFRVSEALKGVIPLTLGVGIAQFMMTEDTFVVKRFFEAESGDYAAARKIGTIVVYLTTPLSIVLFPKAVASLAQGERSPAFVQALAGTAIVSGGVAVACTLFPTLPFWILSKNAFLTAAPLLPKMCWAFLPLVLATLLISNLMARERYRAVPFLVGIAATYSLTLKFHHPSLDRVILLQGLFSSLLLAVSWYFTWKDASAPAPNRTPV